MNNPRVSRSDPKRLSSEFTCDANVLMRQTWASEKPIVLQVPVGVPFITDDEGLYRDDGVCNICIRQSNEHSECVRQANESQLQPPSQDDTNSLASNALTVGNHSDSSLKNQTQSFHKFNSLPREIRHNIWALVCNEKRVIPVLVHWFMYQTFFISPISPRTPAILHVCAEARAYALKFHYSLVTKEFRYRAPVPSYNDIYHIIAQGSYDNPARCILSKGQMVVPQTNNMYINFKNDIIYFTAHKDDHLNALRNWHLWGFCTACLKVHLPLHGILEYMFGDLSTKLERIALNMALPGLSPTSLNKGDFSKFPNLGKVLICDGDQNWKGELVAHTLNVTPAYLWPLKDEWPSETPSFWRRESSPEEFFIHGGGMVPGNVDMRNLQFELWVTFSDEGIFTDRPVWNWERKSDQEGEGWKKFPDVEYGWIRNVTLNKAITERPQPLSGASSAMD